MIFVTNTSRASPLVGETLAAMGIGAAHYEAVISSGDVTRHALLSRDPALFGLVPEHPRCLHLGEPSFVPWLFDVGLSFVGDLADAELVVATGAPRDEADLARLRAELAPAAARGVPLVCTNPDLVIPAASGLKLGPGALAAAYEQLGGRTFLYGKPHAPIYAAARGQLGASLATRVVAVGDLLDTDVRGARAAGIASILVTATGGHAQVLGAAPGTAALDALCEASGVAPDMVLTRFAW